MYCRCNTCRQLLENVLYIMLFLHYHPFSCGERQPNLIHVHIEVVMAYDSALPKNDCWKILWIWFITITRYIPGKSNWSWVLLWLYNQDFYFQISLSHIFHLLYNSAKPTDNYSQIFAKHTQTITMRFLPHPQRLLLSDFCQPHPDDYNQIFTKPTQTTTIRFLPNPPRRLQSNFYQTHPDDYNQIFANPTQTTTIRCLPNPTRRLQSDFYQTHTDDYNQIFAKPTQTITIRFLPHPPRRLQSDFCQTHPDDYNHILSNPPRGLQSDFC